MLIVVNFMGNGLLVVELRRRCNSWSIFQYSGTAFVLH